MHGTLALSNLWLTEDEFVALMEEIGTVMRVKEGRPQEQGRRRWQRLHRRRRPDLAGQAQRVARATVRALYCLSG